MSAGIVNIQEFSETAFLFNKSHIIAHQSVSGHGNPTWSGFRYTADLRVIKSLWLI